MTPLIDGDVLVYSAGFAAEWGDDTEIPQFDYVKALVEGRISDICEAVGATEAPQIFLTGEGNFREKIAVTKPYKGNRENSKKPWHYSNIRAHLIHCMGAQVIHGMEADDAICLNANQDTVICTVDKDLFQKENTWCYRWEIGKVGEWGPEFVDHIGYLLTPEKGSLKGVGYKFFMAQCIMGDPVDNIPGIDKLGPVAAYNALRDAVSRSEMEEIVLDMYKENYAEKAEERLLEQGRLLFMTRELDSNGKPVLWEIGRYV